MPICDVEKRQIITTLSLESYCHEVMVEEN